MTTEDIEWLDARDAPSFIRERRPALAYRAAGWLRDCLSEGDLTAKARKATTRGKHRTSPGVERVDWIVPAHVWKGSHDNSYLDLEAGTFRTSAYNAVFTAVSCRGLLLNLAELSRLLGNTQAGTTVALDGGENTGPDAQEFIVSPLLPHHAGKAIAMRKSYLDDVAKLIFGKQAKSLNNAAQRVARDRGHKDSGCTSVEALTRRLSEDYPKYYDPSGNPLPR